jgi:sec-independent protein translocase protein TatC
VLSVLAVFICLVPFARDLYEAIAAPLMSRLPAGSSMIAIDVASPFLTPFKLSLLIAIMASMPFILYQLWAFVAPALFKHEKRLARPLLFSSIALFYLGCAFAYFVVFPLVFGFLTRITPEGVEMMTDISKYLDFVTTLFLAFGLTFEVPIATIILVATGLTTAEKLTKMRPYVIVGAFAVGMLLTPPDVISQTLMAIPMWLLFEVGILFSRLLMPARTADQASS